MGALEVNEAEVENDSEIYTRNCVGFHRYARPREKKKSVMMQNQRKTVKTGGVGLITDVI